MRQGCQAMDVLFIWCYIDFAITITDLLGSWSTTGYIIYNDIDNNYSYNY